MTDTSKMREKFEAWASARYSWHLFEDARGECDKTLTSWDGHAYGNRIVEGMWQAWQAGRQGIQVTLPRLSFYIGHNVPGSVDYLDHLRNTLEAAGVEVRP